MSRSSGEWFAAYLSDHYRRIGKLGGQARAKKLTTEQRRQIASKAGRAPRRKRKVRG